MTEPPITRRAAHGSKPNGRIVRIVIHATCPDVGFPAASKKGSASGTAKYFEMESSGGSAHYVEGIDREEHCVPEDVSAWHAPPNPGSVGIEITADGGDPGAFRVHAHAYTREQWLSPEVWPAVERAAIRTREICERRGIPKRRLTVAQVRADAEGICGHVDVSAAFGQSSHSDPGPAFPWDRFMALVNNQQEADVPLTDAEIDKIATAAAAKVWRTILTNSHDKTSAQAAAFLVYGNEAARQARDQATAAKGAALGVQTAAAKAAEAGVQKAIADGAQVDVNVTVNGKVQP